MNNKKKKITLFCEVFGNGGIERVISYIDHNIDKKKYDVHIVSTVYNSLIFDNNVYPITYSTDLNYVKRFFLNIFNIKKMVIGSDIIIINTYNAIGLIYASILKRAGYKVIIYGHCDNFVNDSFYLKRLINNFVKLLYFNLKIKYIACSSGSAKFCFGKNKKNVTIIDENLFEKKFLFNQKLRDKTRKKLFIRKDDIVLGNIGRFSKEKNQLFLIDIFNEFLKYNQHAKLILVGTGILHDKICSYIENLNLQDKVIIYELYKNIEELYNAFDFYISTSLFEGYSLTVMEAYYSSLMCFASKESTSQIPNHANFKQISLNKEPKYWAKEIQKQLNYKREVIKIKNANYINDITKIIDECLNEEG